MVQTGGDGVAIDVIGFIPRATVEWVSVAYSWAHAAESHNLNSSSQEADLHYIYVDGSPIFEFFFTQGFSASRPNVVSLPLGFKGHGITFDGKQFVTGRSDTNAGGGADGQYECFTWIGTEP